MSFGAATDCWLPTATPRGKSAEHLDVLVGLAVGDEAMIRERLNTREAGGCAQRRLCTDFSRAPTLVRAA